jgi:hypothetical protein
MYEQKHFNIAPRFAGKLKIIANVAFYGNKVVATDSFRLVELLAGGEAHEPKLYPASLVKAVKVPKGSTIREEDFGLQEVNESFPAYEKLQETWDKEEFIEFAVNGDYLAEIASQLGKLSKYKKVVISIPKKYEQGNAYEGGLPIKFKAPDATAYLMPMKLSDK